MKISIENVNNEIENNEIENNEVENNETDSNEKKNESDDDDDDDDDKNNKTKNETNALKVRILETEKYLLLIASTIHIMMTARLFFFLEFSLLMHLSHF